MSEKLLTNLASRQNIQKIKKEKLKKAFSLFSDKFIQQLDSFINQAIEKEITSVRKLKILEKNEHNKIFEFKLNEMQIFGVVSYTTSYRNVEDNSFTSKIFFYTDNHELSKPLAEIEVFEKDENSFAYNACWYTTEGQRTIDRGNDVTERKAEELANEIVDFFYSFSHSWIERPNYGAITSVDYTNSPFGFQT